MHYATVHRAKETFVALKSGGGLVAWGNAAQGGDTSSVSSLISSGVVDVVSSDAAYAALKSTGQVVTWGSSSYGGDSSSVTSLIASGVSKIYANANAFAVIKNDGSVVAWGNSAYGGTIDATSASKMTSGVVGIYAVSYTHLTLPTICSV